MIASNKVTGMPIRLHRRVKMVTEDPYSYTISKEFMDEWKKSTHLSKKPTLKEYTVNKNPFNFKDEESREVFIDMTANVFYNIYSFKERDDKEELVESIRHSLTELSSRKVVEQLIVDDILIHGSIIPQESVKAILLDHLSYEDEWYIGSFNKEIYSKAFPEHKNILSKLIQNTTSETLGEFILELDEGLTRLLEALISEYGEQQILGDLISGYDGKAHRVSLYDKIFYCVAYD